MLNQLLLLPPSTPGSLFLKVEVILNHSGLAPLAPDRVRENTERVIEA